MAAGIGPARYGMAAGAQRSLGGGLMREALRGGFVFLGAGNGEAKAAATCEGG